MKLKRRKHQHNKQHLNPDPLMLKDETKVDDVVASPYTTPENKRSMPQRLRWLTCRLRFLRRGTSVGSCRQQHPPQGSGASASASAEGSPLVADHAAADHGIDGSQEQEASEEEDKVGDEVDDI
eukprot:6470279-Amphidinium_carterae.1